MILRVPLNEGRPAVPAVPLPALAPFPAAPPETPPAPPPATPPSPPMTFPAEPEAPADAPPPATPPCDRAPPVEPATPPCGAAPPVGVVPAAPPCGAAPPVVTDPPLLPPAPEAFVPPWSPSEFPPSSGAESQAESETPAATARPPKPRRRRTKTFELTAATCSRWTPDTPAERHFSGLSWTSSRQEAEQVPELLAAWCREIRENRCERRSRPNENFRNDEL